jgi:Co/Zn/Cd efflux system component
VRISSLLANVHIQGKAWQGLDMNRDKIIIQKIAAIILILLGLLAMLVAWELLLVSNIHNSTVLVLEMGGVLVCIAGYFLRRRIKAQEEDANIQELASLSRNQGGDSH